VGVHIWLLKPSMVPSSTQNDQKYYIPDDIMYHLAAVLMAKGVLAQVLIMYHVCVSESKKNKLMSVLKYLKHKQCKPLKFSLHLEYLLPVLNVESRHSKLFEGLETC
jgi:hypothetical protein